MKVDALEELCTRYHPKCIYTIPNCQNPSSYSMSLERRKKLLELAYRYDVIILEDDAYAGIEFEEKAALPSLYQLDSHGYVIYLRTFSKTICSGLRLGYMVAHEKMIAQSCLVRQNLDIHPNNISQWLVNEFVKSGLYVSHISHIKQEYLNKCNVMHSTLLKHAPDEMIWTKPSGGYYFWCKLPHGVRASELLILCTREGVVFMPGIPFFTYQNGEHYMRLNFTAPTLEQIKRGIPILCSNIREIMNSTIKENRISPSNYMPVY